MYKTVRRFVSQAMIMNTNYCQTKTCLRVLGVHVQPEASCQSCSVSYQHRFYSPLEVLLSIWIKLKLLISVSFSGLLSACFNATKHIKPKYFLKWYAVCCPVCTMACNLQNIHNILLHAHVWSNFSFSVNYSMNNVRSEFLCKHTFFLHKSIVF